MDKRQETSKSNLGEYTKSKWRLGKTTAIRIPEKIKDEVLEYAKKIDGSVDQESSIRVDEQINNLEEIIKQLKWAIHPKGEGGGYDGRKSKELQSRVLEAIHQLESLK